jgi:hypothetical protein
VYDQSFRWRRSDCFLERLSARLGKGEVVTLPGIPKGFVHRGAGSGVGDR